MSDSKLARHGRQAVGLLAGVALVGGSLAVLASSASAVMVKTPVDLAGTTTTTEVSPINRVDTLHAFSTISNVGLTGSAPGSMLITVSGTTTASVSPAAGLTCGPQVPKLTGFTVSCTTVSALAPGASLSAALTLSPSTNPKLATIGITSTVKIINTMPSTLMDPVTTNNHQKAVTKVGDVSDIRVVLDGPDAVAPTGTYIATGVIVNNGPNPAYAKFHMVINRGLENSFTPPPGVTCTAMVVNSYGTGYSRTCTTNEPVPSGDVVEFPFMTNPITTYPYMNVTVTASKVGASVVDPNLLNNKVMKHVLITDGIIPGA